MNYCKKIGLLLSVITLAACSSGSDSSFGLNSKAVVATVAADFSSGAHSIIGRDDSGSRVALNDLLATGSDITVAAHGNHFYRIERAFSGNNITKFASSDPQTPIWQYSTNDSASAVASNPHDMIFVNETKAYVLRYGSDKAWIVNPSAKTEADFKIGELDLSAYAGADGAPDMDGGVIVGGKLFITLQRLDSFAVTQNAYVAIFDTTTDTEIDANIAGDSLKGIPLQTRNPTTILHEPISDVIFIQGSGSFFPVEYTGGIERINLTDLTTTVILDDGDAVTHPYGLITKLAAISDDILYFVGYESFTDNTLYRLDLATAEITASGITSLTSGQISDLAVDVLGLLWVGDAANATVRVIDTLTDTEVDALSTNLNPGKIVFVN